MGAAHASSFEAPLPVSFARLAEAVASTAEEGRLLLRSWEVNPEVSVLDTVGGDLSRLKGSLFRTKTPAVAAAWGDWVSIMSDATVTTDSIELRIFAHGSSPSRSQMVARGLLDDIVGFIALDVLTPVAARESDPNFAEHLTGRFARPLMVDLVVRSACVVTPARLYMEAPYAQVTLAVLGAETEVLKGAGEVLQGLALPLEPYLEPWVSSRAASTVLARVPTRASLPPTWCLSLHLKRSPAGGLHHPRLSRTQVNLWPSFWTSWVLFACRSRTACSFAQTTWRPCSRGSWLLCLNSTTTHRRSPSTSCTWPSVWWCRCTHPPPQTQLGALSTPWVHSRRALRPQ
jgi:hypothetical protein